MTKLVDGDIIAARERGDIVITPWDSDALGTNSYDVHLSSQMLVYRQELDEWNRPLPLDCRVRRDTDTISIPPEGYVLRPGVLYLASTIEYTESLAHLPTINGKSSLGRLGLSVHVTAGTGDVGFCGHWTLELHVIEPLRIYADMPVAQLLWDTITNEPDVPYYAKSSAKYRGASKPGPQASEMAKNFDK